MVIFTVNGVNYIEKVNILKDVNDDVYKSRDGINISR